jgi:N-methylhydantoinase B
MTYPMTVVDCVFKALAAVIPDRVIAGHHADLGMTQTLGIDPETGTFFQFVGGPQGGGWGATEDADGKSATICINDGDTHNAPIEVTEAKSPTITIEEYSLRQDSGGPGRRRGGLGTRMKVRMRAPGQVNGWMERTACPPWGLHDGQPGAPNHASVQRADGSTQELSGKFGNVMLAPGESHVVELGGGGGFGDPFEREADLVLSDVRAGYVSSDSARDDYGVVLTESAGETTIDLDATNTLRSDRRRSA